MRLVTFLRLGALENPGAAAVWLELSVMQLPPLSLVTPSMLLHFAPWPKDSLAALARVTLGRASEGRLRTPLLMGSCLQRRCSPCARNASCTSITLVKK